jgi:hypothetical protein
VSPFGIGSAARSVFILLAWLGACVSCEIRNPLGPIFLHVNPLEEELGEDSPNSVKGMLAA